jgi:hypothetical protein
MSTLTLGMYRLTILSLVICRVATAGSVTIDSDLMISPASSFPDDNLEIVRGAGDRTLVTIVDGGAIGGGGPVTGHVDVRDDSLLKMQGGYIGDRIFLFDNASFHYEGGIIDSFGDAPYLVEAHQQSVLYIRLDQPFVPVVLEDQSVGNFYGRNLQYDGRTITGLTASGVLFSSSVDVTSASAQVVLHAIAEPQAAAVWAIGFAMLPPWIKKAANGRIRKNRFCN